MSEPMKCSTPQGVANEIVSGLSALAMPTDDENKSYIIEHYWANHAREHFREAIEGTNKIERTVDKMRLLLIKAYSVLSECGRQKEAEEIEEFLKCKGEGL